MKFLKINNFVKKYGYDFTSEGSNVKLFDDPDEEYVQGTWKGKHFGDDIEVTFNSPFTSSFKLLSLMVFILRVSVKIDTKPTISPSQIANCVILRFISCCLSASSFKKPFKSSDAHLNLDKSCSSDNISK